MMKNYPFYYVFNFEYENILIKVFFDKEKFRFNWLGNKRYISKSSSNFYK